MADFLQTARIDTADKAFLIGVQTHEMPLGEAAELLGELVELVENLQYQIAGKVLVNLRHATPALLIGKGKAEELAEQAKAAGAKLVVFDEALSPAQQRNWEELTGMAVIDRQEVILEIFAERASTREAILQVALARMEYSLPRLTRAWTHLSRQRGKGAMGGEGETQLEQDRRLVRNRITHIKEELVQVRMQRGVQRTRRLRVPVPTVSIVGYTNAGKSSLLNTLTGATVLAEDKLFATLDPTTRQLLLRNNQKLLVTDTVGFIRRLPHGLVEAFKATLEEVLVADFLIHVLDVSNPNFEKHHTTTLAVLDELGAEGKRILTVFNKIDIASPEQLSQARRLSPDALFVSAHTKAGLNELEDSCVELIASEFDLVEMLIPHSRYDALARMHAVGHIHDQEQLDEGVLIHGRYPPTQQAFFAPFVRNA